MLKVLERLNLRGRWNCLVVAMSMSKQAILDKYNKIRDPLMEHIFKAILYGDKDNFQYRDHWTKEIFTFLNSVQGLKLKSSNKYPSKEFIKEWLLSSIVDDYSSFEWYCGVVEDICKLKNPPYPAARSFNKMKAWKAYQKFIDQCAEDMSKKELTLSNLKIYIKSLFDLK